MTNNTRQHRSFFVNENETRDLFLKPLDQNEKKYYDIKLIMHQNGPDGKPIDVEVQLKIATLYNADLRTHKIYEEVRQLEENLALNAQDSLSAEIRQQKAKIKILKNRIRLINENAIHQYNMTVLDKARRIEDDGYRPLRIQPDHQDGTYRQCCDVIANEYLVESSDPFDPQTAFSGENELNKLAFLRMIGKIDNDFDEQTPDGSKTIHYKFARLSPAEKERFQGITEIAKRYAGVIDTKIKNKIMEDDRAAAKNLGQFKKNSGR
jgi:hypothetical protein